MNPPPITEWTPEQIQMVVSRGESVVAKMANGNLKDVNMRMALTLKGKIKVQKSKHETLLLLGPKPLSP